MYIGPICSLYFARVFEFFTSLTDLVTECTCLPVRYKFHFKCHAHTGLITYFLCRVRQFLIQTKMKGNAVKRRQNLKKVQIFLTGEGKIQINKIFIFAK